MDTKETKVEWGEDAARDAMLEERRVELERLEALWGREVLQHASARMVRAIDAGIAAAAEEAAEDAAEYD